MKQLADDNFLKSNFSFSPSVFTRLLLQTCKNKGLLGKGLKALWEKKKMFVSSILFLFQHCLFQIQNSIFEPPFFVIY